MQATRGASLSLQQACDSQKHANFNALGGWIDVKSGGGSQSLAANWIRGVCWCDSALLSVTLFSQVITSPLKARLGRIIGLHGLCASMKNQCSRARQAVVEKFVEDPRSAGWLAGQRFSSRVPRHGSQGENSWRALYRFCQTLFFSFWLRNSLCSGL